jgi:hypothetical protein
MSKPVSSEDYGFGPDSGNNFKSEKPRRVPVPSYHPSTVSGNLELAQNPFLEPMLPPTSYNSLSPTTTTMSGSLSAQTPSTFSAAPSKLATVHCTFIPSLPDELTISTGETIRVLSEYDDGWALCANRRGEQGMVPLECLDRSDSGPSTPTFRNSRRMSSLAFSARY